MCKMRSLFFVTWSFQFFIDDLGTELTSLWTVVVGD